MIQKLDNEYKLDSSIKLLQIKCQYTLAAHTDTGTLGLMFACLPSSICTEMLACDKSTPEL